MSNESGNDNIGSGKINGKKEVLIAADTFFPKIDGILQFLKEVIERIKNSANFTFVVPDFGASWHFQEIRIKTSKIVKMSSYPLMKITRKNFKKIKGAAQRTDVIFCQGPALISVLAIYYGKKYGKKVVYFIHNNIWEIYRQNVPKFMRWSHLLLKSFMVYWYNRCDIIIVPYREMLGELDEAGITAKKEVVNLGVDIGRFYPAENKAEAKRRFGIEPESTVIGYVGRISKEKNVNVLLEAAERLEKIYSIKLLIVGSGTEEDISAFKNKKNVILTGFVKDVQPYYQAMDIFIMPSLTETTSLATLEAMACGLPVVATRVGFLKSYVKKNYNGVVFPKGNAYNLFLQLKRLLNHKELIDSLGKNARKTSLRFSWDSTAEKIKRIVVDS